MAVEFYYPLTSAGASLPYSDGLFTFTGGFNSNSATTVTGGRPGPAAHDDDTSRGMGFSNGAPIVYYSFNVDWPSPMVSYDGAITMGMRTKIYQQDGAGSSTNNCSSMFSAAGPVLGTVVNTRTRGAPVSAYIDDGPVTCAGAGYRGGGGAWVVTDFANSTTQFLTIGMSDNGGGGNLSRQAVTSLWGQITFTPPGGGFCFLLGLAGLMSLQLAGPMTDYTQFEKFLQWRHNVHPRHTILAAEEKVTAWDEYKSYKAPRFFYG